MAFFENAGAAYQIKHANDHGHATTIVMFDEDAIVRLANDGYLPQRPVVTDGRVELEHRLLVGALTSNTDRLDIEERLALLVGWVLGTAAPSRRPKRPRTQSLHDRMVDTIRQTVTASPSDTNLTALAAMLGCSPFHVSRVFSLGAGVTLTCYRNRVRASMVVDRVAAGEADLAGLAHELGFADQAHMTKVVRAELGIPPGRVRQTLEAVEQAC
jgi:AraC-like DNA-binding protein